MVKRIVIYECSKCGKRSENKEEIMKCDAAHMGLTVDEKMEYEKLRQACVDAGSLNSRRSNEETNKIWDDAIYACLAFEHDHHIGQFQSKSIENKLSIVLKMLVLKQKDGIQIGITGINKIN